MPHPREQRFSAPPKSGRKTVAQKLGEFLGQIITPVIGLGRIEQQSPAFGYAESSAQILEHQRDFYYEGWQSPGMPLAAKRPPGEQPREFQYTPGINITQQPRSSETTTFTVLKSIADNVGIVRAAIEHVKRSVTTKEWGFTARDPRKKKDSEIIKRMEVYRHFFDYPDREMPWNAWVGQVLEQKMVLDAVTIFPQKNKGGGVYSLQVIDGASIKVLIDEKGFRPKPDAPAFQQFLYGIPYSQFKQNELIYFPANRRPDHLYGFSEVERTLLVANMLLRRDLFNLGYFTEANVPAGFLRVPPEWTPAQIREYQQILDGWFSGNLVGRRKVLPVPGTTGTNPYQPVKEPDLYAEWDLWFTKLVLWQFGINPNFLSSQVNRATAQEMGDIEQEEGIKATLDYVKSLIDHILHNYFQDEEIVFQWITSRGRQMKDLAAVYQIYRGIGVMTVDQIRDELGYGPLTPDEKEELKSPPQLPQEGESPKKPNPFDAAKIARNAELDRFETKIVGLVKSFDVNFDIERVTFDSELIAEDVFTLKAILKSAGKLTRERVKQVFKDYKRNSIRFSPRKKHAGDDPEVAQLRQILRRAADKKLKEFLDE